MESNLSIFTELNLHSFSYNLISAELYVCDCFMVVHKGFYSSELENMEIDDFGWCILWKTGIRSSPMKHADYGK